MLRLVGWHAEYQEPGTSHYVLIVAPHTSNWDFLLGIMAAWALRLEVRFIGKHTLFRPPLGWLFRAMGGVPVDRRSTGDMSRQLADLFISSDRLVLALAPEGTRKATDHWKTGFWHIARAAQVPVVMAYIDYSSKTMGVGDSFVPSDDKLADFELIRNYYVTRRGKNPEQESEVRPRAKP